jgi:hypothetical protein
VRTAETEPSTSEGSPNDAPDETLVDLMLQLSISDRLRSLCQYVNAIQGFRAI